MVGARHTSRPHDYLYRGGNVKRGNNNIDAFGNQTGNVGATGNQTGGGMGGNLLSVDCIRMPYHPDCGGNDSVMGYYPECPYCAGESTGPPECHCNYIT